MSKVSAAKRPRECDKRHFISRDTFGIFCLLTAAMLWGTCSTAQTFAPAGYDPLVVGMMRIAIGGGALLLCAVLRGELGSIDSWPKKLTLAGAGSVAAFQLLFIQCRSSDWGRCRDHCRPGKCADLCWNISFPVVRRETRPTLGYCDPAGDLGVQPADPLRAWYAGHDQACRVVVGRRRRWLICHVRPDR